MNISGFPEMSSTKKKQGICTLNKKTENCLLKTVVGVFRVFFKICSPAQQENFSFPALSFCRLGVFLPFPDFCSLFVPSTQMRNRGKREQKRKFLSKTPNLPFHSPEFLRNSLPEGEQNPRNSSKAPKRIKRAKRPDVRRQGILLKKEAGDSPIKRKRRQKTVS